MQIWQSEGKYKSYKNNFSISPTFEKSYIIDITDWIPYFNKNILQVVLTQKKCKCDKKNYLYDNVNI